MKPIDDEKTIATNEELEKRLSEERVKWRKDIISLIESTKDSTKLAEAQVIQLSYRQMAQEKLAEYRILQEKRQEYFDKLYKKRFTEYTNGFELKLNGTEKTAFINADCSASRLQIKLITSQITYLEETVKTLDNLGFAIRNKLEIISQGLL